MSNPWNRAVRSSGVWRFVSSGFGDATRGLARMTASAPPDEAGVAEVMASSATLRGLTTAIDRLGAACRTSVVAAAAAARVSAWRDQSAAERVRSTGIALLAAAATYISLSIWRRPVAGWLWLVIPVLAAAFGALMAAVPARGSHTGARR